MPKITASNKNRDNQSHLTSSDLHRKPIRENAKKDEKDHRSKETDPSSPEKENLYPDLTKDLGEIETPPYVPESLQIGEAGKSNESSCWKQIIIVFIVALIAFFYPFFQGEKAAADRTLDLTEFISGMKNKFEGQDPQTFNILKSSLKNVFHENSKPTSPAIITIIPNKGAEITASDFCAYIAQELGSKHYVLINESVIHRYPDSLKYDIDTEIKSKFDNRSLNVAVVDQFHNVPIKAAMIFHGYCDHENAPFKRAIFMFIVRISRTIPENTSLKSMDAAAMEAMRSIWQDSSDDVVDSLITRLTVSVINIK